jgi:competence ComEA-like helix-hairpin-helix protein
MSMSGRERHALVALLVIGLTGHLLRAADGAGELPGAAVAGLFDPSLVGDPLAHRDSSLAFAQPLAAGERIDADRASARELERLPGVGPALARRIVADRESRGAFGGIEGLDRVAGVGPATLSRLAPHLSFSGVRSENIAGAGEALVDLNQASVEELDALPGIGPSKARAIVAFRDSAGPFRHVDDLKRVPGVTAALLGRLAPKLRPP